MKKAILLLCVYASICSAAVGEEDAPNILIVIGDDMTWSDCEPYGSTQVHTPNMTKLAREGLCFDAMFTATAMCAPTRQQLYTGLFPVRNGAYPIQSWVYGGVKSLPHHLSPLGYRVGLIGKSHVGPTESLPFCKRRSESAALTERNTPIDVVR